MAESIFGWLSSLWIPETIEIESWQSFLGFTVLAFLTIFIIGFIFWRLRRGFIERIVIRSPENVFRLRKYWWYDVLMMFFLQAFFNLLGGILIMRPLVKSLFLAVSYITLIEFIVLFIIFTISTQLWSPMSLRYVCPLNLRLTVLQSGRKKTS